MNIEEFNKELDTYRPQLESARKLQRVLDSRENELLKVIKEKMTKRGINAIKIDLLAEMGDDVEQEIWNFTLIYEDDDLREWASTVFFDEYGNIQFVDFF